MADNVTLNAGSGGATLKTDQLADLSHVQYVKVMDGTADGTGVIAGDATYGLDVDVTRVGGSVTVINAGTFAVQAAQSGTWTVAVSGSVAVTGTFWQATQPVSAASLPLPSGAATEATLSAIAGYLDTEVAAMVTAAQLLDNCISGNEAQVDVVSSALPTGAATESTLSTLNGKVTACNTGAVVLASGVLTSITNSVAVTGTFWQATQPISAAALPLPSGAATESTLATLDGKVTACNTGAVVVSSGTITSITNSVAVTGTFWQATQPVSGTVTAVGSAAEDANASGNPVLVAGRYDATARALEDTDVGTLSVTPEGNLMAAAACQSSWVYDGSVRCTVKRAMVATSTDGATLIAAVVSKKFRILSFSIVTTSTTATNFWLEDADGADVYADSTGIPLDADGGSGPAGFVLGENRGGWFQTATANKNLIIKLTVAQKVVVALTYIEVD